MTCPDCLRLLDPYLDDQLSVVDTLRVQGHLLCCEPCRRTAESETVLRAAIRAGVEADHAPAGLRERILEHVLASPVRGSAARRGWLRRALPAALVAGLVAVLASLRGAGGPAEVSPLAAEVAAKHLVYAGRGAVDFAAPEAPRVAAWLEARLGFPVAVPTLARPGERLLGARVSSLADRPAGHLLYDRDGRRISLFVAGGEVGRAAAGGAWRTVVEGEELYTAVVGGVALVWWETGDRLYVAASDAGGGEVVEFARRCLLSERAGGAAADGQGSPVARESRLAPGVPAPAPIQGLRRPGEKLPGVAG